MASLVGLHVWLYGGGTVAIRWAALEDFLLQHHVQTSERLLHRLAAIIRREATKPVVRRRAAVALLKLCDQGPRPEDGSLQVAMARGLSLALPRRLATPKVVTGILPLELCAALIEEARDHGESYGWACLHRKYSTCDMPVDRLPSGRTALARVHEHILPCFACAFGQRYGLPLAVVSLFVVRYEATSGAGKQSGLAGHIDESLCSCVCTLSPATDFDGGGTRFERCKEVARPAQGDAIVFLGCVWHEAVPITRGERFVLVGLFKRGDKRDADEAAASAVARA